MNIEEIVRIALAEDLGDGDHTSMATVPENAMGEAVLLAKEVGVLAGVEVAREVFLQIDPETKIDVYIKDGSNIKPGDEVLVLRGRSRSLLSAERTALNFIQRMSGIATYTNKVVNLIEDCRSTLLDTRKTTPCNRAVEKMAVKIGGGSSHRFGLYDMIMIKDNHVDYAGGIRNAVEATHKYLKKHNKNLKIELEVRNFEELNEAMEVGGIDRVMLDNFNPTDLTKALKIVDGKFETEASGGINIETIREFAKTGVDFISVGALTHQIKSLDLSLKARF
jgi:nicotinate-nucleotide pyrophosphorylase (carboxylating)